MSDNEGKIENRRGIGRRTMSWLRNIRDWTGMNVQQLLRTAQTREAFDEIIANYLWSAPEEEERKIG